MQDVLERTTQHPNPTRLALVEGAIEGRDDLPDFTKKLAWHRHCWVCCLRRGSR